MKPHYDRGRMIRRYFRRYGEFWEFTLPLIVFVSLYSLAILWSILK